MLAIEISPIASKCGWGLNPFRNPLAQTRRDAACRRYSDGTMKVATSLSKGGDGFIKAKWKDESGIMCSEVPNSYLQNGRMKRPVAIKATRVKKAGEAGVAKAKAKAMKTMKAMKAKPKAKAKAKAMKTMKVSMKAKATAKVKGVEAAGDEAGEEEEAKEEEEEEEDSDEKSDEEEDEEEEDADDVLSSAAAADAAGAPAAAPAAPATPAGKAEKIAKWQKQVLDTLPKRAQPAEKIPNTRKSYIIPLTGEPTFHTKIQVLFVGKAFYLMKPPAPATEMAETMGCREPNGKGDLQIPFGDNMIEAYETASLLASIKGAEAAEVF